MNIAYTAAVDQAQAATKHLNRVIHEEAQAGTVNLNRIEPKGPARRILDTFINRINTGDITHCEHALHNAGQVLFWSRWKPSKIQCGPCMMKSAKQLTNEELRTCDGCKRLRTHLIPCTPILPSVAIPDLDIVQGPVMIQYGLCEKCFNEAYPQQGETAPDESTPPR